MNTLWWSTAYDSLMNYPLLARLVFTTLEFSLLAAVFAGACLLLRPKRHRLVAVL